MKLLTVLPEDWKGEIDYQKAKFAIDAENQIQTPIDASIWTYGPTYNSFYDIIDGIPVRLEPEPRPIDSIKLSECDGRHLITGTTPIYGNKLRAVKVDGSWSVRVFETDSEFRTGNSITCAIENIKIYDMTK
jgi:uncharacterized protein YbaR (Trm112 family)